MAAMETPLSGYVIDSELTRNRRVVIYTATDTRTQASVVLKRAQYNAEGQHERDMFQQLMAAYPDGPSHVVHLLDSMEDSPDLWLVLERFDHTADELDPERMTPLALMSIALGSAKGLAEMERAGIYDDDVKPNNIAFKTGNGHVAHIDLGYARRAGEPPRGHTPLYAAPEIVAGRSSETSPCYGWARTMEFLSLGRVGLGPDYRLDQFVPWMGKRFAALAAACAHPDPGARPSITELRLAVKESVHRRRRCVRCNAICFPDAACRGCGQ